MARHGAALMAAAAMLALAGVVAGADYPAALFPESNQGLKPERLVTFNTTHYYQLAGGR